MGFAYTLPAALSINAALHTAFEAGSWPHLVGLLRMTPPTARTRSYFFSMTNAANSPAMGTEMDCPPAPPVN